MSEAAAQEPTMEEILASIRRIISEDETPVVDLPPEPQDEAAPPPPVALVPELEPPAPTPAVVSAPPSAAPVSAPPVPAPPVSAPPVRAAREEVLELTQRVEPAPPPPEQASQSLGDLDFADADVSPALAPEPPAAPAAAPRKVETLVGDQAANAAASHFGALSQSLLMPAAGRTLEDAVKELMRPMLKAWLDENLPSITEAAVRTEVERISRRGG